MMRKLLIAVGVCAAVTVGSSSVAFPDFQDGIAAYERGDYATALRINREFAERGNRFAMSNLGVMYQLGQGVPQDYKEAIKWFRKAAELNIFGRGHEAAQFNLGLMYSNGWGVTKNDEEAMEWYRLAAEQGLAAAQYSLGQGYFKGQGAKKNYSEAMRWYRKAAEQGTAWAQYNIGYMYGNGIGVNQDLEISHMWMSIAARHGIDRARRNLAILQQVLTPDQIETAKKLAKEWMEKHQK